MLPQGLTDPGVPLGRTGQLPSMPTSPALDRGVPLPNGSAWNGAVQLVADSLALVADAARLDPDDTLYLLPLLTWQVAAEQVPDCHTGRLGPEQTSVVLVRGFRIDALWACHEALLQALDPGDDSKRLETLLDDYLDGVHGANLHELVKAVERVLAVLALDVPGVRKVTSAAAWGPDQETFAAFEEVRRVWRAAGAVE